MPVNRKGDSLKRILFLCEDNFLAGRFCEEYFNSLVRDQGLNWQAASRALSPEAARTNAEPMAAAAVGYLRSIGAAPVNHRRLPLGATAFDFQMSNFVVAIALPEKQAEIREALREHETCLEFLSLDEGAAAVQLESLARGVDKLFDELLGGQCRNDFLPGGLHRASAVSAKLAPLPGSISDYRHARRQQSSGKSEHAPPRPG